MRSEGEGRVLAVNDRLFLMHGQSPLPMTIEGNHARLVKMIYY